MEQIPDYYELLNLNPADSLAAIQQQLQYLKAAKESTYLQSDEAKRLLPLINDALTNAFANETTRQRYDTALEAQKHPQAEETHETDWLGQAQQFYKNKQYRQAKTIIGNAIGARGNDPQVHAWAALIELKQPTSNDAFDHEQIIKTAESHIIDADAYLKVGEYSEQTHLDVLHAWMEVLLAQGKAQQALNKLNDAVRHASATAQPYIHLYQAELFRQVATGDNRERFLDESSHCATYGLHVLAVTHNQWTDQQFQTLYKDLAQYAPVRHDLSHRTIKDIQDYAKTCRERIDELNAKPIPQSTQSQWQQHFQQEIAACNQRIAWINQKAAQDATALQQQLTQMNANYQNLQQSHANKTAEYNALLGKAQSMSNDGKPPKRHRLALVAAVILGLIIITCGTNAGMLAFILLLVLEVPCVYLAWQGLTAGKRYDQLKTQITQANQELQQVASNINALQTTMQQTQNRIQLAQQDPSQYVLSLQ
ncbi:tetratricopeptide repeat protein [Bifidobacterium saguini DSM 23967]|uniref:Tetratricopeptide repeat protein n=2 Tax=Bifidobacterium saguini TaxID=762210 RepID=A0A087DE72_9BIFI|nr:hypothetical protein [Bifidobacterium saguini]KFI93822.1 tetratricopeptide repeat protein [Bifidobacterium saguini DSM 23967]QTB91562.1 hypothetical protein BSD967_03885 [Bifidobacterium saguini]